MLASRSPGRGGIQLEHDLRDVVALGWPLYAREQDGQGAPGDFEAVAERWRWLSQCRRAGAEQPPGCVQNTER